MLWLVLFSPELNSFIHLFYLPFTMHFISEKVLVQKLCLFVATHYCSPHSLCLGRSGRAVLCFQLQSLPFNSCLSLSDLYPVFIHFIQPLEAISLLPMLRLQLVPKTLSCSVSDTRAAARDAEYLPQSSVFKARVSAPSLREQVYKLIWRKHHHK